MKVVSILVPLVQERDEAVRAMHDLRAQLRGCADALEQQQRATALARLSGEATARERDSALVRMM